MRHAATVRLVVRGNAKGNAKEKDTMEKDTREMGKVKDTRGKKKESATTAASPDIYQEIVPNHSKKEKEKE
jgi:hypothetical protein